MSRTVYIVDGARTPFLKAKNAPGPFTASDLATAAGSALLMRQPFAPDQLDEVILGCASPSPDEVNIGRVVALRLGCGDKVPGWTVMRNCASGMQSIDSAIANIQCGRSQLVLAGGVDALSHAPLLFSEKMVRWLAGSKERIDSSVSPKKSRRTGSSAPGTKTSRMPPRTANSPTSRTVATRSKPLRSRRAAMSSMRIVRLIGRAEPHRPAGAHLCRSFRR